ncbi:UDP-N-acetylmuramoyl-L-alanyl-D-glutamate--2,6-diaminopimelate ligase [Bacteroidota bacterium]
MNLKDILYKVRILEVIGSTDREITSVVFDSRKSENDCLFIAFKGTQLDGHKYIGQAINSGAKVIVCEELPEKINNKVTYITVKNSQEALAIISSNYFNNPSDKIKLIGITGTNGKTTIATLLFNLFRNLGYKVALLSTINNKINELIYTATHTTPDPIQLNSFLNDAVEEGCEFAFMEVSSHAISQCRIAGLEFKGGIFTNITHEHLDYHKTFKNYIETKKSFFDALGKNTFSLTNIDDSNGEFMLQNSKAQKYTYSLSKASDYKAKITESHIDGLLLQIQDKEIWTQLSGRFNAYNLLAVYATAILLQQEETTILTELSTLKPVEGRFDMIKSADGITAIVDYAHSPDALKNIIEAINNIREAGQNLITIIGAGGDRDKEKRPVMGKIAAANSEKVIITSDNPRTEDPNTIIKEIKAGIDIVNMKKTLTIPDRKEAIKTACMLANDGDIILVAGKGHEKYQEINGIRYDFDDKQVINEFFKNNNS